MLAIDAVRAISGDTSALVPILLAALKDRDSAVRLTAENHLTDMGKPIASLLQAALKSEKDGQTIQAIQRILKQIGAN